MTASSSIRRTLTHSRPSPTRTQSHYPCDASHGFSAQAAAA